MTKQTAVQWLFDRYIQSSGLITTDDIEQAHQMFQEQIEEAYKVGGISEYRIEKPSASQYYTQTYGGTDER